MPSEERTIRITFSDGRQEHVRSNESLPTSSSFQEHRLRRSQNVTFLRHLELFCGSSLTEESIQRRPYTIQLLEHGVRILSGIRLHYDELAATSYLQSGRQLYLASIDFAKEEVVLYEYRSHTTSSGSETNRRITVNDADFKTVEKLWNGVAAPTEASGSSDRAQENEPESNENLTTHVPEEVSGSSKTDREKEYEKLLTHVLEEVSRAPNTDKEKEFEKLLTHVLEEVSGSSKTAKESIEKLLTHIHEVDEPLVLSLRRGLEEIVTLREKVEESMKRKLSNDDAQLKAASLSFIQKSLDLLETLHNLGGKINSEVGDMAKSMRTILKSTENIKNIINKTVNENFEHRNASDLFTTVDHICRECRDNEVFQSITKWLADRISVTMVLLLIDNSRSMLDSNRLSFAKRINKKILDDGKKLKSIIKYFAVQEFGGGPRKVSDWENSQTIESNKADNIAIFGCTPMGAGIKGAIDTFNSRLEAAKTFLENKPDTKNYIVCITDGKVTEEYNGHYTGYSEENKKDEEPESQEKTQDMIMSICNIVSQEKQKCPIHLIILCLDKSKEEPMQKIAAVTNGYAVYISKLGEYVYYDKQAVDKVRAVLEKQTYTVIIDAMNRHLPSLQNTIQHDNTINTDVMAKQSVLKYLHNFNTEWELQPEGDKDKEDLPAYLNNIINTNLVKTLTNHKSEYPCPFFENAIYFNGKTRRCKGVVAKNPQGQENINMMIFDDDDKYELYKLKPR